MDVLLAPSIIEDYFITLLKIPKSELEMDFISLINNPLNRFVISKEFISYLEKKHSKSKLASLILPFLSNLINTHSISMPSKGSRNTELEVMESIISEYDQVDKKLKGPAFFAISNNDELNGKAIIFKKIKKPDPDWVLFKLCCHHPNPVVLRYYDFTTNKQIEQLFSSILSNAESSQAYNIVDRQANFEHKLFDSFKHESKIQYFTSKRTIKGEEDKFKKTFKIVKVYTTHHDQIHERKLFRGAFIIELDEDFWRVEINKTTFKIDISFCQKTVQRLKEKTNRFERYVLY